MLIISSCYSSCILEFSRFLEPK